MNTRTFLFFMMIASESLINIAKAKFYMEYRTTVVMKDNCKIRTIFNLYECEGRPSDPAVTAEKIMCVPMTTNLYRQKVIHDTVNFYLVYKASVVTSQKFLYEDWKYDRFQTITHINIGIVNEAVDGPCFAADDPSMREERLEYFREQTENMMIASSLDSSIHASNLARFYAQLSAIPLAKDESLASELFHTFALVLDQMTDLYNRAELSRVRNSHLRTVTTDVPAITKKQFLDATTMALRKMIDPCAMPSLDRNQANLRYCLLYCKFLSTVYAIHGWSHLRRCASLDWATCEDKKCQCFRNLNFPVVGWMWRPKVAMVSCNNGMRFKLKV